jgi:hypothetical protein
MKICKICNATEDLIGFKKDRIICNNCLKKNKQEYYFSNLERIKGKRDQYREANREKYIKACKDYYYTHKERCRRIQAIYNKTRLREDKYYRLTKTLRKRIWDALNRYKSGGKRKSNILYGININTIAKKLLKELPTDFEFGKYHVDHIIPIACFDLNDPRQLKECFKPENHQWLLAQDNLNKSDKILEEYAPIYNKLKSKFKLK